MNRKKSAKRNLMLENRRLKAKVAGLRRALRRTRPAGPPLDRSTELERLALAAQATSDGLWDWRVGSEDIYFSDGLMDMLGYEADDLPHRFSTWVNLMHPEDKQAAVFAVERHVSGGGDSFEIEYRMRRKSGEYIWLLGRGKVVAHKPDGRPHRVICIQTDIGRRKEAEKQLSRTQALLLAAVEQSPAGILIADAPEVRIRLANSAALAIRGADSRSLVDIPMPLHPERWRAYHPNGRPYRAEELPLSRAVLNGETSNNTEMIIRRSDGAQRWVLANAAPVRDESGRIVAGVVVFPDITQRKKALAALSRSERRSRAMLQAMPDLIFRVDATNTIVDFHTEHSADFAANTEVFLGRKIREVLPPDVATIAEKHLAEAFETGDLRRVEHQMTVRGQTYHFEVRTVPSGSREATSIVRDMTDRVRAEQALKDSERRFRTLVETMNDGLGIEDRDGRLVYLNRRAAEVLNVKAEDLIGRPLEELCDYEGKQTLTEQRIRRRSGQSGSFEIRFQPPGGRMVTAILSASPLFDEAGAYQGCHTVITDISERKMTEEALKESQDRLQNLSYQLLKAAEEERRRLAAELHDSVGQSLSAAKYGVESALINLRASSDESSTKSLTAVVGIIQDVIDQIGRIQNQLRPATLDDLGLVATLEWVCREHRTIFDPTELVKNMAVGEEQVPETLKLPLYRIIREALNNVGKHASAGRIVLSLTRETDGLHLEIQDDGVGFDIEAARNETAGNRGLGLESMKERAELSGGRLEIRSQIGQGTVISGHWPL